MDDLYVDVVSYPFSFKCLFTIDTAFSSPAFSTTVTPELQAQVDAAVDALPTVNALLNIVFNVALTPATWENEMRPSIRFSMAAIRTPAVKHRRGPILEMPPPPSTSSVWRFKVRLKQWSRHGLIRVRRLVWGPMGWRSSLSHRRRGFLRPSAMTMALPGEKEPRRRLDRLYVVLCEESTLLKQNLEF